jgi:predicted membrane channel-forming protein YqfA (hemolysin III family)
MEWNFGDLLFAMLALFFWVAVVWTFIGVFADIFRRTDLGGWAKAGWVFLIAVLPFLGVLIYLIARPAVVNVDLPPVGPTPRTPYSAADEIEKARLLATSGAISPAEFATLKEQALARQASER